MTPVCLPLTYVSSNDDSDILLGSDTIMKMEGISRLQPSTPAARPDSHGGEGTTKEKTERKDKYGEDCPSGIPVGLFISYLVMRCRLDGWKLRRSATDAGKLTSNKLLRK